VSELNPYAPPADESEAPHRKAKKESKSPRAWREGNHAVVSKLDARLPKRCVVCNERVEGDRIRRQFSWHPPWVYALFFIGALFYIIGALVTRKGATVELAVCKAHTLRRRNGLILVFGGLALGLVLIVAGASEDSGAAIAIGFLMLIVPTIAGAFLARLVHPAKIDDHHVWLVVGKPFLESLPYGED
jgi:hypothetical protein